MGKNFTKYIMTMNSNPSIKNLYLLLFICSLFSPLTAQPIIIDGNYGDWSTIPATHIDASNDGQSNGIDLTEIKVWDDTDYLYIYINLGKEIFINKSNRLSLLIDSDNNLQTGKKINGIGAEFRWNFGNLDGELYRDNGSAISISQDDLTVIIAPTVSSSRIEMMIRKNIFPRGIPLLTSEKLSLRVEDNASNGDDAPNDLQGIPYTMLNTTVNYSYTIDKTPNTFRMMSWNIVKDRLFTSSLKPDYTKVFSLIDADIIALQEVYDHSAEDCKALIESMTNELYFASKKNSDLVVLSKYPITRTLDIQGNALFIIETPGENIALYNNHFYCCNNDSGRQKEADAIIANIRLLRQNTQDYGLVRDFPIIITGDLNLVGESQTLTTLITGDIINTSVYGNDFFPDADASPLTSLNTTSFGINSNYTWEDNGQYTPGKLDYLIYSDARMSVAESFTFNSKYLPASYLESWEMDRETMTRLSDHLPIVADFAMHPVSAYDIAHVDDIVYPNPASDMLFIKTTNYDRLNIRDGQGKTVFHTNKSVKSIDISTFPSGFYYLTVYSDTKMYVQKVIKR